MLGHEDSGWLLLKRDLVSVKLNIEAEHIWGLARGKSWYGAKPNVFWETIPPGPGMRLWLVPAGWQPFIEISGGILMGWRGGGFRHWGSGPARSRVCRSGPASVTACRSLPFWGRTFPLASSSIMHDLGSLFGVVMGPAAGSWTRLLGRWLANTKLLESGEETISSKESTGEWLLLDSVTLEFAFASTE